MQHYFIRLTAFTPCRRNYKSVLNTGEFLLSELFYLRILILETTFYVLRFPFGLGESIATIKLYIHSGTKKKILSGYWFMNNQYHYSTNSDAIET